MSIDEITIFAQIYSFIISIYTDRFLRYNITTIGREYAYKIAPPER